MVGEIQVKIMHSILRKKGLQDNLDACGVFERELPRPPDCAFAKLRRSKAGRAGRHACPTEVIQAGMIETACGVFERGTRMTRMRRICTDFLLFNL
jgi:hypothetical protein